MSDRSDPVSQSETGCAEDSMQHSICSADHTKHLRIMVVALLAGLAVMLPAHHLVSRRNNEQWPSSRLESLR
jgi:hypothetical protein